MNRMLVNAPAAPSTPRRAKKTARRRWRAIISPSPISVPAAAAPESFIVVLFEVEEATAGDEVEENG